ncbi:MAG: hypothetical protein EA395_15305 [Phormidium sp. GEM2.Bin31]|nr:hypothetical protein [Phormidium sp. BM_Day4_Bin.17]TVR05705.1 MAG: hypothetical protein EA395_15305 [Phormidium sp. GEM2.Bin31]UCJ12143.1 MAG: hypothetical protein JWS08_20990 [Phormidium sp. PBR-2020]
MSPLNRNPSFPYWLFILLWLVLGGGIWIWVSQIERQRQQAVVQCLERAVEAEAPNSPEEIQQLSASCTQRCIRGELTGCP